MNEKSNTKKSKRLVSAGVFIGAVFRCVRYHWMLLYAGAAPLSLHDQPDCPGGCSGLSDASGKGSHAWPYFYCSHATLPVSSAPGKHLGCGGDWCCGGYPG